MKKTNLKVRLVILSIASFIVSVAPLIVCLFLNRSDYVKTPGDGIKLTLGGIILAIFVFLKVIGKLKMPRRIVAFGIVFVMAYLLQAVLQDLLLLSGMALMGEFIDYAIFQRVIKKTREDLLVDKTADATTAKVEEVIKKYIGRA